MTNGWAAVCRFGGVGDNLITSSVLPGLKAKYGRVEVITQKPHGIVFENNPHIDKLTYKGDNDIPKDSAAAWQSWFRQRAGEYAFFRHLSHTCEFELALFPEQCAFDWPAWRRRQRCGQNYLELVHDVCDLPYDPIGARFFPTDEELERAHKDKDEKLRNGRDGPVVGWVCSGTRIDKRHPRAGYAVARMITELGATVVLFGGFGKDILLAKEIETQVKHHNGDLDGFRICMNRSEDDKTWELRRSLTQLQLCDLVVAPDTGPTWAVSMCEMPKIVIVSHASAQNITKHFVNTTTLQANVECVPCFPCHRLHNDNSTCTKNEEDDGPACTSDVSVQTIVEVARTWLADPELAREYIAKPMTKDDVRAVSEMLAHEILSRKMRAVAMVNGAGA